MIAPPGYTPAKSNPFKPAPTRTRPPVDLDELRQQKAWELATAPAKQVPMQAFMMYMSGSGIQIFSIMSVWFLLKQAVAGAMGVQQGAAGPRCLTSLVPSHVLMRPRCSFRRIRRRRQAAIVHSLGQHRRWPSNSILAVIPATKDRLRRLPTRTPRKSFSFPL